MTSTPAGADIAPRAPTDPARRPSKSRLTLVLLFAVHPVITALL